MLTKHTELEEKVSTRLRPWVRLEGQFVSSVIGFTFQKYSKQRIYSFQLF